MVSELEVGDGMVGKVLEPPTLVVSYQAPPNHHPGICQFSTSGLKCQMSSVQKGAGGRKTS